MTTGSESVEQWLAIRKEAALRIDPATAEVEWAYGYVMDPYDVYELSEEEKCVGRVYFARSPGSDVWVSFHDLAKPIVEALWDKHSSKLMFPAGLEEMFRLLAKLPAGSETHHAEVPEAEPRDR